VKHLKTYRLFEDEEPDEITWEAGTCVMEVMEKKGKDEWVVKHLRECHTLCGQGLDAFGDVDCGSLISLLNYLIDEVWNGAYDEEYWGGGSHLEQSDINDFVYRFNETISSSRFHQKLSDVVNERIEEDPDTLDLYGFFFDQDWFRPSKFVGSLMKAKESGL